MKEKHFVKDKFKVLENGSDLIKNGEDVPIILVKNIGVFVNNLKKRTDITPERKKQVFFDMFLQNIFKYEKFPE